MFGRSFLAFIVGVLLRWYQSVSTKEIQEYTLSHILGSQIQLSYRTAWITWGPRVWDLTHWSPKFCRSMAGPMFWREMVSHHFGCMVAIIDYSLLVLHCLFPLPTPVTRKQGECIYSLKPRLNQGKFHINRTWHMKWIFLLKSWTKCFFVICKGIRQFHEQFHQQKTTVLDTSFHRGPRIWMVKVWKRKWKNLMKCGCLKWPAGKPIGYSHVDAWIDIDVYVYIHTDLGRSLFK